jgi:nucleoporin POM34
MGSSFRGSPGSPFGSPLAGGGRRLSYNATASARGSPLSLSEFENIGGGGLGGSGGGLATPTKGGNKATLGLNNKWLYEKGRGSPGASLRGSPGRMGAFS